MDLLWLSIRLDPRSLTLGERPKTTVVIKRVGRVSELWRHTSAWSPVGVVRCTSTFGSISGFAGL